MKKPVSQFELKPWVALTLLFILWLAAMWLTGGEGFLPKLDETGY